MQQFQISSGQAGQRLDKYLRRILPEAQDGFLYKMLRKKNITLNGRKAEGREMLRAGDAVTLFFSDETYAKFAGNAKAAGSVKAMDNAKSAGNAKAAGYMKSEGPAARKKAQTVNATGQLSGQYEDAYSHLHGISILYEDENILILNKPVGILSQKAEARDESLNEWMIGYLLKKGKLREEELERFRPSVLNRLDRNTSGLVLCGTTLAGSQALSEVIQKRLIRKFYRTVVAGKLMEPAVIEGYLSKDEKTNTVTIVSEDPGGSAVRIRTSYRPLRILEDATYLEVELITGKTHQIRAHLSDIGHPILGDPKYGNVVCNARCRERFHLTNQLLHAARVEFPDPLSDGKEETKRVLSPLLGKSVAAPLPALFQKVLDGQN